MPERFSVVPELLLETINSVFEDTEIETYHISAYAYHSILEEHYGVEYDSMLDTYKIMRIGDI